MMVLYQLLIIDAPITYIQNLKYLNYTFTAIFCLEATIKLIGLGFKTYFRVGWNRFDFSIVVTSLLDITLDFTKASSSNSILSAGPQLIRTFRMFRATRLFRLIKQFKGLQNLIDTAIYALPAVLNVSALLFLVFFIASVLAVFLFKDITEGKVLSSSVNFSNFHNAFILLFRSSTGEDWYRIMFDVSRTNGWNILFFLCFIVIQQFVMLNLFILIILD
jgi:hypothetical protein